MISADAGRAFLASAQQAPTSAADDLLAARAGGSTVKEVPLAVLPRWQLGDDLRHDTGRFFSIEGLAIETSFGKTAAWRQPIIMQPEVGMLGFLAKRVDGALHVLAQAKMEPGNSVPVQLSPTVQATPSNYLRVHGGRPQPLIEHFLGETRGRVLADLVLSEQGTRYYRKRNRNIIVEVDAAFAPPGPDFAWLSLADLRAQLAAGGRVNMNARGVLACVQYAGPAPVGETFPEAVLRSQLAPGTDDELESTLGWLIDVKTGWRLDTRRVRLGELDGWIADGESIRRADGRFFRVIGIEITAQNREISSWMQPMFAPVHTGTIALLCQRRAGVLQILVQARIEPGFLDSVEIGATVQCTPANYARPEDLPPFAEYLTCPDAWVRLRAGQSEDGGRFFHDNTENLIVELPEDERVALPPNFRWMTIGHLQRLMRHGYLVDIEIRSLLACLN